MVHNFSPEQRSAFQAYTRLTVVPHLKAQRDGIHIDNEPNKMSFKVFFESLEKNDIVNPSLAREVDLWQIEHSKLQKGLNRDPQSEEMTMHYVKLAYQLGLVNLTGSLYGTNQQLKTGNKQKT